MQAICLGVIQIRFLSIFLIENKKKYDAVLEGNDMAGGPDQSDFQAKLKDGVILCRLANALGGNIKFNQSKMAFKMVCVTIVRFPAF